jgi:dimethylglycine dehydrogenase
MRVSFSGELAYELHIPNASLYAAYTALTNAGKSHNLGLFGAHAVDSMRLEMGYLHWKADLLTEFDPYETGLVRFVQPAKSDFVGKSALAVREQDGPRRKLVSLVLDCTAGPAHPGASVVIGNAVVGTVTSGGWGHRTGLNLAYAFVLPEFAEIGTDAPTDVLGTAVSAKVIAQGPYRDQSSA